MTSHTHTCTCMYMYTFHCVILQIMSVSVKGVHISLCCPMHTCFFLTWCCWYCSLASSWSQICTDISTFNVRPFLCLCISCRYEGPIQFAIMSTITQGLLTCSSHQKHLVSVVVPNPRGRCSKDAGPTAPNTHSHKIDSFPNSSSLPYTRSGRRICVPDHYISVLGGVV